MRLGFIPKIIAMKNFFFLLFIGLSAAAQNHKTDLKYQTIFESSKGLETGTYQEVIAYFKLLAQEFPQIHLDSIGMTDSGLPLHLAVYNPDKEFDFDKIRKSKLILMINNGIHPGEPDGIDATILLFRDLALKKIDIPKNVAIATIPIYNVGGSLNRNSTSRTNQLGPTEYGFRGNARNYDLNRDFIKADTKNARTFIKLFQTIQPDVFIDNHVSNGADYQYTLTHLFTQHNKLGSELGDYLHNGFMPGLESSLADQKWDITPYVNVFNEVPEKGFTQFMDYPRYSTGYAALFNTLGLMVETHMLKPYQQRVEGTYALMASIIDLMESDHSKIKALRAKANLSFMKKTTYPIDWEVDSTKFSSLNFKGYEGKFIPSEVTSAQRLKYDRHAPFEKPVVYRDYFKPKLEVEVPTAYIIPKGWWNVIDLLKLNNVSFIAFEKDTLITVESYKIDKFETRTNAYEGHYQHFNTNVEVSIEQRLFQKGDLYIPTNQNAFRYLLETLEPQAPDSFFNWNFFDTILQQKEGFSPYVWEDLAAKVLKENPHLKMELENKRKSNPEFANNWYAQLDWLHKQSPYYEAAHMQYPVYRVR